MIYGWREDAIRLDGDRLVIQIASPRHIMVQVVIMESTAAEVLSEIREIRS
jgi:hypothetical protein